MVCMYVYVCVCVCAVFSPVRQRSYTFHTSLHYNQFGGRLNISFEASLCQVSELKCTYNFHIFQQNLSLIQRLLLLISLIYPNHNCICYNNVEAVLVLALYCDSAGKRAALPPHQVEPLYFTNICSLIMEQITNTINMGYYEWSYHYLHNSSYKLPSASLIPFKS